MNEWNRLFSSDADEVLNAIAEARAEGLRELAPAISGLLRHEDAEVREQALYTLLLEWKASEYRQAALDMLRGDSDPRVRSTALWGIAQVSTAETRDDDTRLLIARLLDPDEDQLVRESSYCAMLLMYNIVDDEIMRKVGELDLIRDVDWKWVQSLLRQ